MCLRRAPLSSFQSAEPCDIQPAAQFLHSGRPTMQAWHQSSYWCWGLAPIALYCSWCNWEKPTPTTVVVFFCTFASHGEKRKSVAYDDIMCIIFIHVTKLPHGQSGVISTGCYHDTLRESVLHSLLVLFKTWWLGWSAVGYFFQIIRLLESEVTSSVYPMLVVNCSRCRYEKLY